MATSFAVRLTFTGKPVLRGAGEDRVWYANASNTPPRCSGVEPPGHAAYAPLAYWLTPLRRLFWRRRDSPPLPAHGRCRPVTPASLLFPRKEVKQEKRQLLRSRHFDKPSNAAAWGKYPRRRIVPPHSDFLTGSRMRNAAAWGKYPSRETGKKNGAGGSPYNI